VSASAPTETSRPNMPLAQPLSLRFHLAPTRVEERRIKYRVLAGGQAKVPTVDYDLDEGDMGGRCATAGNRAAGRR